MRPPILYLSQYSYLDPWKVEVEIDAAMWRLTYQKLHDQSFLWFIKCNRVLILPFSIIDVYAFEALSKMIV